MLGQRFRKILGVVICVPLLLWLTFVGLSWGLGADSDDETAGQALHDVALGTLEEKVAAPGFTQPKRFVVMQSEIAGVIAQVHVDDGDRVARGDLLIELDRRRLQGYVEELRASLAIAEAQARVESIARAEVELRHAESEFGRIRELSEHAAIAPSELERHEHRVRVAKISLADAEAESARRRAAVELARARLSRVEADLQKAMIRSPLNGVVVRREVEVGTAVTDLEHGGTETVVLADDKSIHVLAKVDENDIAFVDVGQTAEVRIDAFPDQVFYGAVRKVSWSGSSEGGISNFDVEVELENNGRFRVGMSADVRIVIKRHLDVLLVPTLAIYREEDGKYVRVVRPDASTRGVLVPVQERYSDGIQSIVSDGLAVGDKVLVPERVS